MRHWRWALHSLLALLVGEGMLFLAVLRGGLPDSWRDPLTATVLVTALAVVLYETFFGTPPPLPEPEPPSSRWCSDEQCCFDAEPGSAFCRAHQPERSGEPALTLPPTWVETE